MLSIEDQRTFLIRAYEFAKNSPDESTQVGACIVKDMGGYFRVIPGWNHFHVWIEPYLIENKYTNIWHAEAVAIRNAVAAHLDLGKCVLVAPWAFCTECAKLVTLFGINKVVRHKQRMDLTHGRWVHEIQEADKHLKKCGVEVVDYDGILGVESLISGKVENL